MRVLNILILTVTIIGGYGLTIWLDHGSLTASDNPAIAADKADGEKLPDFAFTDIHGKAHKSKDFAGEVIIVNFWATWCAPCVIEFPKLAELARQHKNLTIIALSSDTNDAAITKFLQKHSNLPKNLLIARDARQKITADLFQTYRLPESIIVNPDGKMIKKIAGDTDWLGTDMADFLKENGLK